MALQEVQARDWTQLQELLFEGTWNEQLGRFRSSVAYRGLSTSSYPLSTTLIRLGGRFAELERHLLRRHYSPKDIIPGDTPRPGGGRR